MAVLNAVVLFCLLLAFSEGRPRNRGSLNSTDGITTEPDRRFQDEYSTSAVPATSSPEDDDSINRMCRLTTVDPYIHSTVVQMLTVDKMTLIQYQLNFTNYTHNPLSIYVAGAYDAKKWSRVTTAHGQTLLSLAFNYGVLSMMTLTLGTSTLNVELRDSPPGCMGAVDDQTKIESVRRLLMRDFDANGSISTLDDDRICHEIIVDQNGYAKFRHSCCYKDSITGRTECTNDIGNIWLSLLYGMLTVVRFGLIFFGPSLFVSAVLSMSKDNVPYVVRLKSKLEKTVCFYRADDTDMPAVKAKKTLDLSSSKGFPKLHQSLTDSKVKFGQPIKVRFPEYRINVDYKRMQKENVVPVGLFYSIFSAIFLCKVRFLEPFKLCCKAKMFRSITWGKFCKRLGTILLVLLVPVPFYLRLLIFYEFEYDELQRRKRAIAVGGLRESLESSLLQYFTPTHGVFIFMYMLYVMTAIALAFLSHKDRDHRVKKMIVNSFRELKGLSFTETLSVISSNMVWPLKNFGVLGCCVGIIYWPVAIVGSLMLGAVYFLPTLYLTARMAYHSKLAAVIMSRQSNSPYKVRVKPDHGVYQFQTEKFLRKKSEAERGSEISLDDLDHIVPKERMLDDVESIKSTKIKYPKFSWLRAMKYIICAFLSILTLYAVVLILSEVVGCLVEIVVFTIMGCIVNASALLKYVMLIVMIVAYCGECFNNMQKKYLKMNRALFNEVKYRIKDLEAVTSQPSSLQENCGFKAQELDQQADYEASDDVANKPPRHWMINDLVLFIDSEDTPRIPIQLFNDVIHIRVAGVPGPIYRGHIEAFQQLSKIILFVVFVFLVVLSFGSVHKISATNQTLATLVGGFMPRMLRMFLAPPRPEVELGTVSFRSKMDEVIKNFSQYWPIYDLPFEVVTDDDADKEEDKAETKEDKNKNTSELLQAPVPTSQHPEYGNLDSVFEENGTFYDESDGSPQRKIPTWKSIARRIARKKKLSDVTVTVENDAEVDIAVCLPATADVESPRLRMSSSLRGSVSSRLREADA